MRHFLKLLAIVLLVAAPQAAGAQDIRINPVPPRRQTPVDPGPRGAPGLLGPQPPHRRFPLPRQILFFLGKLLLSGPCPEGPWKAVVKVPEVFYQIDPAYFKTVKKAGEAPAAPGGSTPPPKAKIIDLPPTAPPAQAPPEPGSTPPGSPEAPGAPAAPPKVM